MSSYKRSAQAYLDGKIQPELFPVEVTLKKGKPPVVVAEDEEYKKINFEKFTKLPTVFQRDGGSVTAGNASTLSDGAAACLLMTADEAEARGKSDFSFKILPLNGSNQKAVFKQGRRYNGCDGFICTR